ncbi:MAG: PRC-barrel domain-containing protein, partial [Candidatus Micrarchaeota archaeon]|nr:PRC-barrel domain-containing protein [Candidatus Micrarchaeota archaeon]
MSMKMSQLIGMEVYTDKADHIGKIYDVIIDLQKGEAARLTLEPIRASSPEEAKRIFREKTVMYKSVRAVEKIVIV